MYVISKQQRHSHENFSVRNEFDTRDISPQILLAVAVFCSQAFSSLAEEFPSTPASGSGTGFGAIESTTLANGMKVDIHE